MNGNAVTSLYGLEICDTLSQKLVLQKQVDDVGVIGEPASRLDVATGAGPCRTKRISSRRDFCLSSKSK